MKFHTQTVWSCTVQRHDIYLHQHEDNLHVMFGSIFPEYGAKDMLVGLTLC